MNARSLFFAFAIFALNTLPVLAISGDDVVSVQNEDNISITEYQESGKVRMMRAKESFNLLSQGDFKEFSYGAGDFYFVADDHEIRPDDEVFGYVDAADVSKFNNERIWDGTNHF